MESSTQTAPARPASTAKGGSGRDNVAWRTTSAGRNVALLTTDLIPGRPLRLWGAAVETSDGGAFVRLAKLGPYDGWSIGQLLAVALARFEAEQAHSGEAVVAEIVRHLDRAAAMHREPQDGWAVPPVSFEPAPPGSPASPFPWSLARAGRFSIQMCPDAEARQRGVSPEQLLLLIELALSSWLPVTPWRRTCWQARRAVRVALALEAERASARWAAHLADCDAEPGPG
ncbi:MULTISPECIES: hypothetical protein [unclassified Acidocella]|uniref:hypothetical protein n=1 Tax=unclassified Acidocella TaxID=2648610 RepID=UPI001F0907ED|nr:MULTISPECIES: hypothetical protein [unclassified Acidocella]WBO58045.1 hypothetical protein GT370_12315 [Acidocella sp. MX-AZ03]